MKKPAPPIPKAEWVRRFAIALRERNNLGKGFASVLAEGAYIESTNPEAVARGFNPGDFARMTRSDTWPPGFVSQGDADPGALKRQEAAVRGRATQLANGHTGSMRNGLSKKSAAVLPRVEKALVKA